MCDSTRAASFSRSTSRGWSPNIPINWFSKMPPADLFATPGPFRHFRVLERRRNDSVCSYIPAQAGIPRPSTPTRIVRYWVSIANRRKLLLTGLSYKPDAMIAIGDHVYWDLRSPVGSVMLGNAPEAQKLVGQFTRDMPVLGTDNERKLKLVATPQICDLYGTDLRSMPVFFVQDDHDYFENDEATEQMVTFPPDDFMLRLARATQRLYYPEFLPDSGRPIGLPSSGAADARLAYRNRSARCARQVAGDPDV